MDELKIYFECLGFATNPLFISVGNQAPMPYGTVVTYDEKPEFWRENYMPNVCSEEQVLEAYKKQLEEKGVILNDVSKEAWLEDRFGEQKWQQKESK